MVEEGGADDAIDTFNAEAFGELAPGHRYDGQVLDGPVADGE